MSFVGIGPLVRGLFGMKLEEADVVGITSAGPANAVVTVVAVGVTRTVVEDRPIEVGLEDHPLARVGGFGITGDEGPVRSRASPPR